MSKLRVTLLVIIVLLIGVRVALPSIIKSQANKALASLDDYEGHVDDVHIALWRGAFGLDDLQLKHRNEDMALTIKSIDMGINWRSLLKRAFDIHLDIESPRLRMLVEKPAKAPKVAKEKGKEAEKRVEQKTGKTLPEVLSDLVPFRISEFTLNNGTIRLKQKGESLEKGAQKDKDAAENSSQDDEKESGLEARINQLKIDVTNLTNTHRLTDNELATAKASAKIMNSGNFKLNVHFNPLAKEPTFDLDAQLKELDLEAVNPVLRWQTGVDVAHGTFDLFTEAAAKEGRFKGYVKPVIQDLKVVNFQEDKKKPLKLAKKAVIGAVAWVFKNKKEDQLATKLPIEGSFENPKAGIWEAVIEVLRNAFIKALQPSLDREVSLKNV